MRVYPVWYIVHASMYARVYLVSVPMYTYIVLSGTKYYEVPRTRYVLVHMYIVPTRYVQSTMYMCTNMERLSYLVLVPMYIYVLVHNMIEAARGTVIT